MDVRQLRYFVAVAEEKNIGRAAKRLFISQPPLTRQIQQLEQDLGVQLFDRTSKGVELTQAGKLFLTESKNILSLMELAQERTRRAGQGLMGRLDVAVFGSGILKTIPEILQQFKQQYPEVHVVLHSMNKGEQIEALRQKRISLGFNRMLPPLSDIDSIQILRENLMVALHQRHPLAAHSSIDLASLAGEPLIVFPNSSRPNFVDLVVRIFQEGGVNMNIAQVMNDAVAGVALVSGGFGVCLVPTSTTCMSMPGVVYRPLNHLPENATLDLSCVYLKDNHSPLLSSFLSVVHDYKSHIAE